MKKIALIVFIIGIFAFFTFGLNTDNLLEINEQAAEEVSTNSAKDKNKTNNSSDEAITEELVINQNTCIGCGRCVNTEPDNFAFDQSGRVAEVISQDDIYKSSVMEAIQKCPVGSIKIS